MEELLDDSALRQPVGGSDHVYIPDDPSGLHWAARGHSAPPCGNNKNRSHLLLLGFRKSLRGSPCVQSMLRKLLCTCGTLLCLYVPPSCSDLGLRFG